MDEGTRDEGRGDGGRGMMDTSSDTTDRPSS